MKHDFPKKYLTDGFTLIELMVTIAVAGILMGIGIPSFSQLITSNRLTTNINELVTSLTFARSEAIKRGQPVTLLKTGAEWESGWTVFTDLNGNGVLDNGDNDILLKNYAALPSNYTLRSTPGYANSLTYQATGISQNGSFVLCDNTDGNNAPEANTAKVAIINSVGRVRMGMDTDNDGIPEKDGGEISSCTTSPFT